MAEEKQDLTIWAGEARTLQFTYTDTDSGDPVDITSVDLRWALSDEPTDSAALVEKGTDNPPGGITRTNPTGGVFTVALAEADTEGLNGRYHHEAWAIDGGVPLTIAVGEIKVRPTVLKGS